MVDRILFSKSLIKHRNSSGARTVPCGTSDVTLVASLCSSLTNPCCHLPVRKSFNQAKLSVSLDAIMVYVTSGRDISVVLYWRNCIKDSAKLLMVSRSWVLQDWPWQKLRCSSHKIL